MEGLLVEVGVLEGAEVAVARIVKLLGVALGDDVGTQLGIIVGTSVGIALGDDVGTQLGIIVGTSVGDILGTILGVALGDDVGTQLGIIVEIGRASCRERVLMSV